METLDGLESLRRIESLPLSLAPEDPGDFSSVEERLRSQVEGEVRFDHGSRALYATDGSNYRMPPIGVVVPETIGDVVRTVEICRREGLPILPRGGGTSLSGETCNTAVILEFSKNLRRVLEIDPEEKWARVEPGVVLDELRREASLHGLTFGPDPSTHAYCTLGGMIGNNSCGVHSVLAGRTSDNIDELEILTYDGLRMWVGPTSPEELERLIRAGGRRGEIYSKLRTLRDRYADLIRARFPKIPRLVSGYALDQLLPENGFHVARALVGTEGTCVTVLEAKCRLIPDPSHRILLVLGYPDIAAAGDQVPELMKLGPIGLEGFDDVLAEDMKKLHIHEEALAFFPEGGGWLLFEVGGFSQDEVQEKAREVMSHLEALPDPPRIRKYEDPDDMQKVWLARESGLGVTARVPGRHDAWEGWEDSAVPPERLGSYLRGLRGLFDKHGYHAALYGHFGQGCVHTRIDFALETSVGLDRYHRFMEDATSLCVSMGGSLSGEHGDGQARAEFLSKMFGDELVQAFREFKAIWDPEGKMNPGKLVNLDGGLPFRTTENLRLGPTFEPAHPTTYFKYPDDDGDFARAATRCVGVGLCRRTTSEEGVMCPSYMVTLEEKHTTRGRAHALFEMLHGGVITDGWKSKEVKETLDLCLSCKGCKSDCPMKVDMATYKAEFLAHHYKGRARPRAAYAMGLVYVWARAASLAPRLANAITQTPLLAYALRWMGGITQEREIPRFAPKTFRQLFEARPQANPSGPLVILWPDTFNNHFHPEVALAAVDVMEAAGFQVALPRTPLCCGRPLYDYGMLPTAKALLSQIMEVMGEEIDRGVPVVGLEPSCLAVFRDELRSLFPKSERANRLATQSLTFSEFMNRFAAHVDFPPVDERALVQTHCHQHGVIGFDEDRKFFNRLGVRADVLKSGCCGMAGSFGFEKEKYDVSVQIGERVLLPKVREERDALILADGFSCKTQIAEGAGRKALHVAEVARLSLAKGPSLLPATAARQERRRTRRPGLGGVAAAALVLGAGAGALLGYRMMRR